MDREALNYGRAAVGTGVTGDEAGALLRTSQTSPICTPLPKRPRPGVFSATSTEHAGPRRGGAESANSIGSARPWLGQIRMHFMSTISHETYLTSVALNTSPA